jgi:hypothetical protein
VRAVKERAALEADNAELRRENEKLARNEGGVTNVIHNLELQVACLCNTSHTTALLIPLLLPFQE